MSDIGWVRMMICDYDPVDRVLSDEVIEELLETTSALWPSRGFRVCERALRLMGDNELAEQFAGLNRNG